ncbi:p115 like vesicle tethering protein [Xylariomycetidae sp. FL2044]|nr:p115 like vesicle tethering protein [Xylariomycetidae sp. FL2044]
MFSIASAPAKQSVGETITVLSSRLNSATLLEDRRAAILGLRSFAKEYPASVASGALRSLIGSLSKDGEDVDTVKVVLETLLMLFNPNQDSHEASEEIALWLADEFTQRQENITLLLDFLETTDFYSRLYSLQLLVAILSARTERTEECVWAAPLGIPRLVAALDDRREAVRNEALTLLTYLTPSSPDIQGAVAYEAYDRIFAIVAAEGSLADGDRIVEDCLILLANLLRLNLVNQTLFRESGHIPRLANLLEGTYLKDNEEVAQWAQEQRNRNTYALLAVIRLFLVQGAIGTAQNQAAFWQHGVLYHALQLAFSHSAEMSIRAEALATCADIIKGHSKLQESFAQLQVPSVLDAPPLTNGQAGKQNGIPAVYVIDGLLDLTLSVAAIQAFDLRLAACQCLKAYFFNHNEVRLHFLRRAIEGHASGVDETANVFTTLLRPANDTASADPYRHWFAASIMLHLVFDNAEAKALAMSVTEGDADSGEELVTSIQTITAHLVSGLSRDDDERISVGYLMLLTSWLFEDLDGVNDFLGEGSNLQELAKAVTARPSKGDLVQGLCAMILGVVYEFSTKDSPIPRHTLHSVILSRVGREKYIDALSRLRSHPYMRNFEVIPQKSDISGDLPEVFFDPTFVDFFKDNYGRLRRAIDRDPGMEISVVTNGVQKGISREMVDSLRGQVEEKERALQTALTEVASLSGKLGQEQTDHRRSKEASAAELGRIKNVNEAIQRHHEEDIKKIEARQRSREDEYTKQLEALRKEAAANAESIHAQHRAQEAEMQRQLEYVKKTAESEAARIQRRSDAEMADLRATISRLEVDLMRVSRLASNEGLC